MTLSSSEVKQWHQQAAAEIYGQYAAHKNIRKTVSEYTTLVDSTIGKLWQKHLAASPLALFATGGYGRGELLPRSDIDLMILASDSIGSELEAPIAAFVTDLWDVGLAPGIAVRSHQDLVAVLDDISIATTIIECRLICGNEQLSGLPRRLVAESYSDSSFFTAKQAEQKARHAKYNHTEYNLEPDIKNAPGGLRDIHQIGWVAKRHFRVNRFYDLVHLGFLSEHEYNDLRECETFLWQIRYALHTHTGRDENKLLFDYQHIVAAALGYQRAEGEHPNRVIETFMRDYYRCAMKISTLNEMLLLYFYESVIEAKLPAADRPAHVAINNDFKVIGDKIAVTNHKVFANNPIAILHIFELLATQSHLTGIRARTLRLLMLSAKFIDQTYRDNPVHQAQFMRILAAPTGLFALLKNMKRYGILGQYLPAFGKIIGLMQYDLFHIYTVDAHTLVLVRNLQRFSKPEYAAEFPHVSEVYQRQPRKDLLILAAMFHDIAKGRGGDHSELGALDAITFCLAHGLNIRDAKIVAWLTRSHLLMSLTAQKQDIADPEVIERFAQTVGDELHLDLLYCLTVADINATNTNLWNSWRASLMRQLYTQTRRLLRTGLGNPIDKQDWIQTTKTKALEYIVLQQPSSNKTDIDVLWAELGDDYFLREQPTDIAWHTLQILAHGRHNKAPLVMLSKQLQFGQDAMQLFVYTQDAPNLFAATVATLDALHLNVLDARIMDSQQKYCLDTYIVMDPPDNALAHDTQRQNEVLQALQQALETPENFPALVKRRSPRQLRHFDVPSEITIRKLPNKNLQALELMTLDHPGLLARVGYVFAEAGINIHSAKIATLGERVEDVFFISHANGSLLSHDLCQQLQANVLKALAG